MKVLIVEDNQLHQKLLERTLKAAHPEFQIEVIDSGEKCLEVISKKKYNMVLLDYNLPKMTGLETLKKISEKKHDMIIIMITGMGNEKIAVEAMKLGAYDYLTKSVDFLEVLLPIVDSAIEKYKLKKERDETEEKIRDLYRASLSINIIADLDRLLALILKLTCDTFKADGGSVMLYDEKTKELIVKAVIGKRSTEIFGKKLNIGERIAGKVAMKREPVLVIGDIRKNPAFKDLTPYEEVKSGITVIMISKGKLVGVMNVKRTKAEESFTQQDLNILSIFASNITVAIENSEIYSKLYNEKLQLEEKLKELEKNK